MHVITRPNARPFTWYISDFPNVKGQTMKMELEYEVIDRLFHCTVHKRNNPRDRWPERGRAATADEMAIAKAAIGEQELARCLAESINPSIWARAAHSAKSKRPPTVLRGFRLYASDGSVLSNDVEVNLPPLP